MVDTSPFPARGHRSAAARVDAELGDLLRDLWSPEPLRRDADGAYEFRYGCAAGWVSVVDTAPVMVRVTAHAAYDVVRSPELWAELNDVQLATLSASVAWCDGTVFVSQTLHPAGLNAATLAQAVRAVGGVADSIGPLLAGVFGGQLPYEPDTSTSRRAG